MRTDWVLILVILACVVAICMVIFREPEEEQHQDDGMGSDDHVRVVRPIDIPLPPRQEFHEVPEWPDDPERKEEES